MKRLKLQTPKLTPAYWMMAALNTLREFAAIG
jgi:hypothetical protein